MKFKGIDLHNRSATTALDRRQLALSNLVAKRLKKKAEQQLSVDSDTVEQDQTIVDPNIVPE